MQVIQGLYAAETTRGGRAYLVEGPMECVVVDTGAPDGGLGAGHMIGAVKRRLDEVRLILLTSADPDFAGNAAALREITGARLAASAETAEQLREAGAAKLRAGLFRRTRWPAQPVRIEEVLTPRQVLDVAGGIEVIAAPGRVPGALAFHCYGPGALMLGDAATVDRGGRLRPPAARRCVDPAAARETVERLAAIHVRVLCPGRGLPTVDGHRPARVLHSA